MNALIIKVPWLCQAILSFSEAGFFGPGRRNGDAVLLSEAGRNKRVFLRFLAISTHQVQIKHAVLINCLHGSREFTQ